MNESDGLFYAGGEERGQGILTFKQRNNCLSIDFESSFRRARQLRGGNLLLRSMKGLGPDELVVDTCCGMGDDLMCLRGAFQQVVGIERHHIIYQLLKDAQQRFSLGGVDIICADARNYHGPGRVFYMDPMYPPGSRGKSLAKGPMELLKQLCGQDQDQEELLAALLAKGPKRVVVKRARRLPTLFPKKVKYAFEGKLVRFDIY